MLMLQGNGWGKVILILVGIVACVILGATFLNVVFPNAMVQVFSTFEDMAYRATGLKFDLNGDGKKGGDNSGMDYSDNKVDGTMEDELGEGVEGWGE